MQFVVGWWVVECYKDHNVLMDNSNISDNIQMFTVCTLRTQSMRCCGPLRARVGYRCVEGWWWLNIEGLGEIISDSLFGMVIGEAMLELARGNGFGVTGVECVENCCDGGWDTWIGASCIDASCGRFVVFGTSRDNSAASKIVARFLSSERWSELAAVANNGKGCLSAFTNSLSATNILVVGDNVGDATYVK